MSEKEANYGHEMSVVGLHFACMSMSIKLNYVSASGLVEAINEFDLTAFSLYLTIS